MSANIFGIAYSGSTPWHGLGKRITDPAVRQSLPAAMQLAGIDFEAARQPLYLGDGRQVTERYAIVRNTSDGSPAPVLGTVGPDYTVCQYREALGLMQPLLSDHGVTIETVGALGQGEVAWLLCKLPDTTITPAPGDDVRGYFLVRASHDGSTAVTARPTPIRVVCQNTLGLALSGSRSLISLRHTASITQRIRDAQNLIKALHDAMSRAGETYAQLAERRITAAQLAEYLTELLPNDRPDGTASPTLDTRRRTIARLTVAGYGADGDANGCSLWGAANAVAEYLDHVRPAESTTVSGRRAAWTSAIFGASSILRDRAFGLALDRVKVAA